MSVGAQTNTVAIFDFDGTITFTDSLIPFLRETSSSLASFVAQLTLSLPTLLLLAAGLRKNHEAKEALLKRFLFGKTEGHLHSLGLRFANARLKSLINPEAVTRLQWHLKNGHEVIILSASPEIYLEAWASQYGIRRVIGTRLAFASNSRCTGRLNGLNCHGLEKIARLKEVVGAFERYEFYMYADGASDKPLLEHAQHRFWKPFRSHGPLLECLLRTGRFVRALI